MKQKPDYSDILLAGIYFLTHKGKIVYVGEADCIARRLGDHKSEGVKIFDNFKFISTKTFFWLDSVKHRLYAEHKCIRKFKPKYNKKGKIYSNKFFSFNTSEYTENWRVDGRFIPEFRCFGVKEVSKELGISMKEAEPIFDARENELEEKYKEWEETRHPSEGRFPEVVKSKYGGVRLKWRAQTKEELGYP
tara:strand:+ start:65 stop:637 length:573 start_codon:yes stop_codon:yes gene_type:complete